ncbi:hypothetical protein Memar_1331 [Methanoculleus marisnigri JR1]|uniref:Uncharacterized protein n=1 Tax=Methanoculleus marisnigri (strain ATCC 35101 / DSM 1498 / JR1) TaxID=368407 RepID=A3CV61_METMJ|nr:hypothetical protein Memar_1331 [Methanoculleus marisnigri JR1]
MLPACAANRRRSTAETTQACTVIAPNTPGPADAHADAINRIRPDPMPAGRTRYVDLLHPPILIHRTIPGRHMPPGSSPRPLPVPCIRCTNGRLRAIGRRAPGDGGKVREVAAQHLQGVLLPVVLLSRAGLQEDSYV